MKSADNLFDKHRLRQKIVNVMMRLRSSVLAVSGPLPLTKAAMASHEPDFMGLAKNMTAYGIAAIAHNVRKGAKFLTLYGLTDQSYAG